MPSESGGSMADTAATAGHAKGHHDTVGVLGASALVAGSMVGSGVYLLPATFGATGSISILGWIVALLAALAIAGMFSLLSRAAPSANGLGDYVQTGLGRFFGVQTTVAFWTLCWVGNVAVAVAVVGAAGFLVPALTEPAPRLVGTLAVIWFSVAVSCMLVRPRSAAVVWISRRRGGGSPRGRVAGGQRPAGRKVRSKS